MAGERQTGPDAETHGKVIERRECAICGGLILGVRTATVCGDPEHSEPVIRRYVSLDAVETIRGDTIAEIVAFFRDTHTPLSGRRFIANLIEMEFGCDAENGETA